MLSIEKSDSTLCPTIFLSGFGIILLIRFIGKNLVILSGNLNDITFSITIVYKNNIPIAKPAFFSHELKK